MALKRNFLTAFQSLTLVRLCKKRHRYERKNRHTHSGALHCMSVLYLICLLSCKCTHRLPICPQYYPHNSPCDENESQRKKAFRKMATIKQSWTPAHSGHCAGCVGFHITNRREIAERSSSLHNLFLIKPVISGHCTKARRAMKLVLSVKIKSCPPFCVILGIGNECLLD